MNKKQLFASLVGVLVSVSAFAETGAFAFKNTSAPKTKVLGVDGLGIGGANYLIGVLVKDPSTGNFTDVGLLKNGAAYVPAVPLTGANAGLFTGGVITVPFLNSGGTATVKVVAWDVTTGASYNAATTRGTSVAFDIVGLGSGAGSGGNVLPPDMSLVFPGLQLQVIPEPSTYALAALGHGGLLLFRCK